MSPRRINALVAVLLVITIGLFAGAVVQRREADLRLVKSEVNFLRELILTLESRNGRAPEDCGREPAAWEALITSTSSPRRARPVTTKSTPLGKARTQ